MGTNKDVFTTNQIKDILQIHEQSIIHFFNLTLDRMDKGISNWRKRCIKKLSSRTKEIPTVSY